MLALFTEKIQRFSELPEKLAILRLGESRHQESGSPLPGFGIALQHGGPRDPRHHGWITEATIVFLEAYLNDNDDARNWLQQKRLEAAK